jgi:hypothetical protein
VRLDEQLQAYADKLLLKRRREIDADLKKNIEAVVKGSTPPGSVLPGLLMQGLVEVYIDRIRSLGNARMDSLLTAHEDAGITHDEIALQETKSQVPALCYSEHTKYSMRFQTCCRQVLADKYRPSWTRSPQIESFRA